MLQLGPIQFEINDFSYDQLRRATAWQWPSQERIGRRPALQYTGKAEETIGVSGTLYPPITGGPSLLRNLRAEADRGEPLDLVDGLGNVLGLFVVKGVQETWTEMLDNGLPRKIAFQIELAHYGEDDEQ